MAESFWMARRNPWLTKNGPVDAESVVAGIREEYRSQVQREANTNALFARAFSHLMGREYGTKVEFTCDATEAYCDGSVREIGDRVRLVAFAGDGMIRGQFVARKDLFYDFSLDEIANDLDPEA